MKCSTSITLVQVSDGADGASVSIKSKTVEYLSSTSGTTTPSGTWTPEPNPIKGQYLWTKTTIVYTNGTSEWPEIFFDPTYIPTDGKDGEDGVSPYVTDTILRYQNSTDGINHPDDEPESAWTEKPNPVQGYYTWARTTQVFSDGKTSSSYTSAYSAIDGAKGDDGDKGTDAVNIILSNSSIVVPADEYGIVDSSAWKYALCTVTVIQGDTPFEVVEDTPTENGTYMMSASESTGTLVGFTVSENLWKCTENTAMLSTADAVNVSLSITYKDVNGNVATVLKVISVIKNKQGKSLTLWFSWSSSETEYKPANASAWVCSNSFIHYNGSLVGDFSSNGYGDVPYKTTWLQNWAEVQAARTDEYRYLWCKTSEDGTPFLFTQIEYETQYAIGDNNTEPPSEDKWSYDMPNIVNAKYIWIRKKILGSANWGTPVCSSIGVTFTENMIRLSADEAYLIVRDGVIELKAENIFAKGSIQADTINLDDLMAQQLILKGGGVIKSDGYDTSDTSGFMITADGKLFAKDAELSGTLKSQGYELGDYETKNKGFYLGREGTIEIKKAKVFEAFIKKATITDATLESGALVTVNENILGAWCATCGLPSESGSWSAPVKTVEVTTNSFGQEVVTPYTRGTLSYNQSFPGYWKTTDLVQWMKTNIPVNNNGFTKLTGTIFGYNAYAKRFTETTWNTIGSKSWSEDASSSSTYSQSFSIDCGLYYQKLKVDLTSSTSGGTWVTYWGMEGWIYIDGVQAWNSYKDDSGYNTTVHTQELSPGTHTVEVKFKPRGSGMLGSPTIHCTYTLYTSVTEVYSLYDGIELRLYTGSDTTKVFAGGTSSDKLDVILFGEGYPLVSNKNFIELFPSSSDEFYRKDINLTYNGSTFKGGDNMTSWTVNRYNMFMGLFEVGAYDEETDAIKWKTGTLTARDPCQFKINYVYINGTLYSQYFDLTWTGTVMYLRSYDGTISLTYSTNKYYTDLSYISFAEVAEPKGVYTASLYPKKDETNVEIGSISNPYKRVYTEALMGLYPIGSIYLTIGDENPDDLFGGEWELLPAGYALWTATSTNKNGNGNTIAAGLPNIKGSFYSRPHYSGDNYGGAIITADGKLFSYSRQAYTARTDNGVDESSTASKPDIVTLNASSYNSIYSDSITTVQPPAYKIKAYRRES